MAYPRNLLNDDEEIVLDRNPHWSFMIGATAMVAASSLIAIAVWVLIPVMWWLGILLLAASLLGFAGRYLRWITIEFVVTTDRVIVRTGILSKAGTEIPLDRIMNISYRQAFWERILGTGDLVIESAGESGHQPFTDVANPAFVQNVIYRQSELYQGRNSGPVSDGLGRNTQPHARSTLSIPEQLEKLVGLRDRGVITEVEFQQQKQSILRNQ